MPICTEGVFGGTTTSTAFSEGPGPSWFVSYSASPVAASVACTSSASNLTSQLTLEHTAARAAGLPKAPTVTLTLIRSQTRVTLVLLSLQRPAQIGRAGPAGNLPSGPGPPPACPIDLLRIRPSPNSDTVTAAPYGRRAGDAPTVAVLQFIIRPAAAPDPGLRGRLSRGS